MNPGTMAATVGLSADQALEVCKQVSDRGVVVPANFNSAAQIVLSGEIEAVEAAVVAARKIGAKKAVILNVGGAFHSPLMESARAGLADYLQNITPANASKPVIANVTAAAVSSGEDLKKLLVDQVTSPVRWADSMKTMVDRGVSRVFEIGPGKVLSGLARREMRPEQLVSLDTMEDIQQFTQVGAL